MPDPALTPLPRLTGPLRTLLDPPEGTTTLELLAVVHALQRAELPIYEAAVVYVARKEGHTWDEIGAVLRMARQNVARKYRTLDPVQEESA